VISKIISAIFLLFALSVRAQYKNDNVLYKTVDWKNLCSALQNNQGYLLLDVRSPGEYNDTSAHEQMNIGHLKGAQNINVRELGTRLSEINNYKNKPVFVYCSHSQRSRRASKMLADSGFTNVFNINGGMTAVYYSNAKDNDCLKSLLVTKNNYSVISAADVCKKVTQNPGNIFLLDVRSDSAFRHISTDAQENAYGIIKQSVNIPFADLEKKLSSVPHNKEIIVIDLHGGEAAKTALFLKENVFVTLSILIERIVRLLSEDNDAVCINKWYVSPVSYAMLNPVAFGNLAQNNKDGLLLDVRNADEFANKSKDSWRNIGHLKNAVNIPAKELSQRINELNSFKNKPVLLYDFSGSANLYEAANKLQQQGFTKVNVLVNGLFNIRWVAANRSQPSLKDLLTGVPADNL
jgi:rhodanese-related sulfurtransferase